MQTSDTAWFPAHFMKGMTYAGFSPDVFLSPESDQSLEALRHTNSNWVAVAVGWWQDRKDSIVIQPNPDKTPTDASLVHVIRSLGQKGVKVLLKPFVDAVDHSWRAEFRPTDWDSWFASYKAFMLHYAKIAAAENVALLSIGVENYLGPDPTQAHWQELIAEVRAIYAGPLTHSANFNGETGYDQVRFWDQLDYIGIDAYFSTHSGNDHSLSCQLNNWQKHLREIQKWRQAQQLRQAVLFTEIGICSYKSAAATPWQEKIHDPADGNAQARYYQAFFEAARDHDWLHGSFWWWWDNPSTADYIHADGTYANLWTPKGKPAETVLKLYYGLPAQVSESAK
ncbi:MAG: hypothetical protein AAF206_22995 [Bacteroidota bacterium]